MLESLRLQPFRGFADFTIECAQLTVLVGPNSSGKTTLLQAIDLLGRTLDHVLIQPKPTFRSDGCIGGGDLPIAKAVVPCDPESLWPERRVDLPCRLIARFSRDIEVDAKIGRDQ